ncbi:similar to Saccharomyces cerevisiae YDL133W SRF1 Regulator of phospholipase D (Spo14p) [Maudiozyma saulgeensis]|uniref:Similar to Saccharomyces cerevisiae YDL133W SRF1 Regulator of phospholipase D (Spo14p) n=1 Tax=Maudiozyma saulgeensis TaxID=1789683 RepID=A0A1X7QXX3_9SACH|nr:similar to Saccharomyces cerevisiae YDL133W SRF1 Regulator of phospholipase D (Spo14p) [Kazachstania saulgeensis]
MEEITERSSSQEENGSIGLHQTNDNNDNNGIVDPEVTTSNKHESKNENIPEWMKPVMNNMTFTTAEERKLSHLNSYSLYPTTVPPFALEEQFKIAKILKEDNDNEKINNKIDDDMLPSNDLGRYNWTDFAENIGSNVAYADNQKINIMPSNRPKLSRVTTRNSNFTESMSLSNSSIDEEEKMMIRKEVLQDLNEEWGGEERLQALYNLPMQSDFQFKTQKDRNEWATYVARAKQIYYGKNYNKKNDDNNNDNGDVTQQLRAPLGTISGQQSIRSRKIDWLEDFNADKERWRKIRDKKMKKWMPKISRVLIENQYLPLTFRICITVLSLASLGLAVRIYQNSDANIAKIDGKIPQEPSTIMAICVNSIAVFYTIYIAADEFSGQPIGLRNPLSKLKLILLDLLFIIFSSANLALAFNTRYDQQWVCTTDYMESGLYKFPRISYICRKQKALSSFLFVLLFMWVGVFIISIIRVVEKVSSNLSRN